VIEKKRERERILRREKRRKHTEKENTRHQVCLHCVFVLHLHCTSHHEPLSSFHSIPIIINQTTFYAMLTTLPKYTNQISLTEKMQASKPLSEPYKHHISTKTPLTNTQEQNYVYPDFLSCI